MTMQPSRDIDAARRRAERIRIKARSITEQYSDLRALVDEAERCEDHLTLGYPSWTAYLADLFGDEPLRLPRDERIPMSQMLADKGMSTRAIGAVLGVGNKTVARDLGVSNDTPDGEASPATPAPEPAESERIDPRTGEVLPQTPTTERAAPSGDMVHPEVEQRPTFGDDSPAPRSVVGLDGKTYTRPAPQATKAAADRRPPLRDGFRDAALDLAKIVGRFERLAADDRLSRNKNEVARYANDLTLATDALQRIAEQLTN